MDTVTEKAQILSEIHALLAQQMDALQKKLTHEEMRQYGERDERVRALIERLNREHLRAE